MSQGFPEWPAPADETCAASHGESGFRFWRPCRCYSAPHQREAHYAASIALIMEMTQRSDHLLGNVIAAHLRPDRPETPPDHPASWEVEVLSHHVDSISLLHHNPQLRVQIARCREDAYRRQQSRLRHNVALALHLRPDWPPAPMTSRQHFEWVV